MSYKKLYIIGNGFDIHHRIPSRYDDFRQYLKNKNQNVYNHVIQYLPVKEDWCDLEAAFANLDTDSVIDEAAQFLQSYSADDWSDSYHHDYQYELDKIISNLSSELKTHFCEWISGLEIPNYETLLCEPVKIDSKALFLTFNYTQTLEHTYNIKSDNILHIHGQSHEGEEGIVLGHSWNPADIPDLNNVSNPEDMDTRIMEGNELINSYFGSTFKPADNIIHENYNFFNGLKSIKKVFVLGHSLSDVDLIYFEEIHRNIHDDAQWVVTFYGGEIPENHKNAMDGLGIKNLKFCKLNDL